jgi:MFS family permease
MSEESRGTNWPQYRLVIGLSFLQSLIWGLVVAMFPLYARELGAAEFTIGSLAAVHPLLSVIAAVPIGMLGSRIGRRGMFYLAYAFSLAAAVAYMFTRTPASLILPQLFFGLSAVTYWPTQSAHISDNIDPTQRARFFGLAMGLTGLGGIIGPVVAGRIADSYGFQAMYGFFGIVAAVGLVLCRGVKPAEDANGAIRPSILTVADLKSLLARPASRFIYLSVVAMFVQWGLRDTFLPLYAADLNLTRTAIGGLATMQTISMSGSRLLLVALGQRAPAGRAVLVFVALSALATLAVPGLSSFGALAAISFVAGIGSGAFVPLNLTNLTNVTDSRERPMAMSLETASSAAGRLISSLTFGFMASQIGIPAVFLVGNVAVLLAVFGLARMRVPDLRGPGATARAPRG